MAQGWRTYPAKHIYTHHAPMWRLCLYLFDARVDILAWAYFVWSFDAFDLCFSFCQCSVRDEYGSPVLAFPSEYFIYHVYHLAKMLCDRILYKPFGYIKTPWYGTCTEPVGVGRCRWRKPPSALRILGTCSDRLSGILVFRSQEVPRRTRILGIVASFTAHIHHPGRSLRNCSSPRTVHQT